MSSRPIIGDDERKMCLSLNTCQLEVIARWSPSLFGECVIACCELVHWQKPTRIFTIKIVSICQCTRLQYTSHTVSKESCGDYHAMAASQGVLNGGWKRDERMGFDGRMVCECPGVVFSNN